MNGTAISAFSPLPWQISKWNQLTQEKVRIGHALLLSGQVGIGKTHLAQAMASWLLCSQPTVSGACGVCQDCQWLITGNHPDYSHVAPQLPQGMIKIDDIRQLTDFVYQTAHSHGIKVVIIDRAHALNQNAANALLKTLEEPPSGVYFILVSDNIDALSATILSRCQHITCRLPAREQALTWLSQQYPATATIPVATALQLAKGAPLQAQILVTSDLLTQYQQCSQTFIELSRNQLDPITISAAWHKLDGKQLLCWLYSWVLDMMKASRQIPKQYWGTDIDMSALQDLLAKLQWQDLTEFLDNLLLQLRHLEQCLNLNKQLMLESLLIRWQQIVTTA